MAVSKPFYGLDERIPARTALLAGLQHVLAMFVGIITPPLIIAGALNLDTDTTSFLVAMSLFASGVTTLIQVKRVGPVGSGMLSVQGTSFTFVPIAIQTGGAGGLPLIFGLTILASPVEMVLSRFIKRARRLFPPVVTGTVVMLIGTSLIQVGMTDLAGGYGASDFGSLPNVGMGLFVMLVIIVLNRFGRGFLWSASIAIGLLSGYALATLLGRVDVSGFARAGWFALPQPFRYGVSFDLAYLLPWVIGYLVTTIETIGDLTATSEASRQPVSGPSFVSRLEGGVLADGLGSLVAGALNCMPNTTFSQNNGVITLTGIASRRAGMVVALVLVVLGLFPKFAYLISVMPKPVLGGATLILFATVAMTGFRIVAEGGLSPRNQFIVAISLALGLGVTLVPNAFSGLDEAQATGALGAALAFAKAILQSGMTLGAVAAIVLNLIFPND